jgi:hypothetical protein
VVHRNLRVEFHADHAEGEFDDQLRQLPGACWRFTVFVRQ